MKNKLRPISQRISRVYYKGGLALLILYSLVFNATILLTENLNSERRLAIVAPYHFQLYEQGQQGTIKLSPLIHIYDDRQQLPNLLRRRLSEDFTGVKSFQLEDEVETEVSEYVVFAGKIKTPTGTKLVYAVETTDAVEWGEFDMFLVEAAIFIIGFVALLVIAGFIVRASSKISEPFIELANQLENMSDHDFEQLSVNNVTSIELAQTLSALNNYRTRISELLAREKSFTRYISHELRTPMTVVKGAISVLRKQDNDQALKQAKRIHQAIEQMEQLTQTFLLLARNEDTPNIETQIDDKFVSKLKGDLEAKATANQTSIDFVMPEAFSVKAEPLLLYSATQNILLNAINSTIQGKVTVEITKEKITVMDTGVGLNEKARGYEGFGVGLLLVKDICQKYNWQFQLEDNDNSEGCTAVISFT